MSISDVNDNPPVFDEAVYNISLLETTALGTIIERVLATDLDIGSNSALEYSFIDGNTDGEHPLSFVLSQLLSFHRDILN